MHTNQLNAEVVSIGDEITSGSRVDTNAAWISRRLSDLGVDVQFHSTVGDTLQHNIEVFRTASQRADVVVCTGGLGPTRDDLTREALAAVVHRDLEFREDVMEYITSLFARINRPMPDRNRVQAMFPVGSVAIFNPRGTAPGIDLAVEREGKEPSRIYALPGVPSEMYRMFDESVAPQIIAQTGGETKISQHVLKFFGIGESDMERRLGDMIARGRQPRVGITASSATISLRITATGATHEECDALIEGTRQEALRELQEFHYGDGELYEQYHAIDDTLRERNQTIGIVELGDAAMLCNWFATLGEGSSYRGGLSLRDTGALLTLFPAADPEQSFDRARQALGADWLLLVDNYPVLVQSGNARRPSIDLRVVIVPPDGIPIETGRTIGGNPDILHTIIAKSAMLMMRKTLATV